MMSFQRVVAEGRRAYCRVGERVLCYEPRQGVHVLWDSVARRPPWRPQLWLGELPDLGWQHSNPDLHDASRVAHSEAGAAT